VVREVGDCRDRRPDSLTAALEAVTTAALAHGTDQYERFSEDSGKPFLDSPHHVATRSHQADGAAQNRGRAVPLKPNQTDDVSCVPV
jgi:hypothetical protein